MSIHQDLICSGYSSGAVVVWETGDRDNNLSYRELMTPDSQGNKPQVTSTAVNSTLCTAGFNNGNSQAKNRYQDAKQAKLQVIQMLNIKTLFVSFM